MAMKWYTAHPWLLAISQNIFIDFDWYEKQTQQKLTVFFKNSCNKFKFHFWKSLSPAAEIIVSDTDVILELASLKYGL